MQKKQSKIRTALKTDAVSTKKFMDAGGPQVMDAAARKAAKEVKWYHPIKRAKTAVKYQKQALSDFQKTGKIKKIK